MTIGNRRLLVDLRRVFWRNWRNLNLENCSDWPVVGVVQLGIAVVVSGRNWNTVEIQYSILQNIFRGINKITIVRYGSENGASC